MMKICLVNVSDVDEAMRSRLRVWRNSEKVSPFFLLDQVTEEQHRAWLERNVRGEGCPRLRDLCGPGSAGSGLPALV